MVWPYLDANRKANGHGNHFTLKQTGREDSCSKDLTEHHKGKDPAFCHVSGFQTFFNITRTNLEVCEGNAWSS